MADYSNIDRRTALGTLIAGTMVGLAGCNADTGGDAEQFPTRDIAMICPWSEGGGTDRTARALADGASQRLSDVSAYVTNQTGGTGSVGFNATANADPDGHTVGVVTVEITTIEHLGVADVNHNDVDPVMGYNFDPAALTVREDAPYSTLQEFIDYAEENPGEINVGTSGSGGIWHLSMAGFADAVGIELGHVGYDGAAPATQAVLSGEVEATTSSAAEVAPQVLDGPLTTLAHFGENRLDLMPDVPTLIEEGTDFTMGAWRGLAVPNDTPADRVEYLRDLYTEVYESEEFQQFMSDNGFGVVYRDTQEFGEFMQDSYDSFDTIIDNLGLAQ